MASFQIDIEIIEQGDIYFFYKPKKGVEKVSGMVDVARTYFVLDPFGKNLPRYVVMGAKKMPEFTDSGDTNWGFVQMVGGRGFEVEKAQKKPQKGASRPVGEGIYAIVAHRGEHTHLLYSLELPKKPGIVQKELGIKSEADYIILSRTVEDAPSTPDTPFSNFTWVNSTKLNQRGTEILLVGVGADIGRLGLKADKENETFKTADVFSKLKVDSTRHPTASLISGKWE